MQEPEERIRVLLVEIYGTRTAPGAWRKLQDLLADYKRRNPAAPDRKPAAGRSPDDPYSQADAVVITYGDQLQQPGRNPLSTLAEFADRRLTGLVNTIHILPFYPYTSDDGFSITDFWQVNPALGSWEDIQRLGHNFRLMFDAVINHLSRSSAWFQGYVEGDESYLHFFIEADPKTDLSATVRPRALPLLTEVSTSRGPKHVWTTFSNDQIDLNYAEPGVLLKIIDLLLFYIEQGAAIIRLDAIAYLWKEPGTASIHLRQTHAIIKIFRAIVEITGSGTLLITETNVPHEDNISYFGQPIDGSSQLDEAHLVYQFPLAPLVIDAVFREDVRTLSGWAAGLAPPSPTTTFFNFIASHDGIGLMPARGLLSEAAIKGLIQKTQDHGGGVSYKHNPDGSQTAYELNITLFDLLNGAAPHPDQLAIDRFLATQFVLLSMAGIPGIYIHSLFGSRNCEACVGETGRARSINREKLSIASLDQLLDDPTNHTSAIYCDYAQMLKIRTELDAFHPARAQRVLDIDPAVFALARGFEGSAPPILCLANFSQRACAIKIPVRDLLHPRADRVWSDQLSELQFRESADGLALVLKAYERLWLAPGRGTSSE